MYSESDLKFFHDTVLSGNSSRLSIILDNFLERIDFPKGWKLFLHTEDKEYKKNALELVVLSHGDKVSKIRMFKLLLQYGYTPDEVRKVSDTTDAKNEIDKFLKTEEQIKTILEETSSDSLDENNVFND